MSRLRFISQKFIKLHFCVPPLVTQLIVIPPLDVPVTIRRHLMAVRLYLSWHLTLLFQRKASFIPRSVTLATWPSDSRFTTGIPSGGDTGRTGDTRTRSNMGIGWFHRSCKSDRISGKSEVTWNWKKTWLYLWGGDRRTKLFSFCWIHVLYMWYTFKPTDNDIIYCSKVMSWVSLD